MIDVPQRKIIKRLRIVAKARVPLPLHVAAFLCHTRVVELLLEKGISARTDNGRGETPAQVVSGEWSQELAGFYRAIADSAGLDIDLEQIERERPRIAKLLRRHAEQEAATADGSTSDKEND